MSVQIDDNEVILPLPRISTGGTEPPGSGGDALPTESQPPVVDLPSHDARPGWRPAMELSSARGDLDRLSVDSRLTEDPRAGELLNSQVSGISGGQAETMLCSSPTNRSSDIRVHPGPSRSVVHDAAAPIGTEMVAGEARRDDELPAAHLDSGESLEAFQAGNVNALGHAQAQATAKPVSGDERQPAVEFRRAADIAAFLGISKKQVHRRAIAEQWPAQQDGNRIDYAPPFSMPSPTSPPSQPSREIPATTFTALSLSSTQRQRVHERHQAVLHYLALAQRGVPLEGALVQTVAHFAGRAELPLSHPFLFSVTSLRRWRDAFAQFGLNGLVDQKQGRVGRKPVARFLDEEQRARLQAESIEHGSIARAGRNLMRDPSLHAGVRAHLHGGNQSKSYVPPSIREAARTSPLTAALHTGPRAARLLTSSVHSNPESVKCGDVYVADDETPNIYVWEPWPNKLGYRIGRPQILQVSDCGSLMPLVIRVVMRASGAYTADDVAGTLGDAFDNPGLPKLGLLLEGGVWRANTVLGHKTNLSVEDRIGGLSSLGLEIFHARTPMAKWEIEGQFHLQQHIMDKCPGYCGRNERTDLPEKTKKLLAQAERGAVHPSEFLLSLDQFASMVADALREYTHERADGKTLRGASPWEKWNDEKPRLRVLAEKDKWLYRSALCVTTVKRNGELRVTHGSGRNARLFYYHNAPLLMPRAGQEIFVYWNDHNPQADAVLLAGKLTNPNQRVCIGTAQYVREISRFATSAQDKAELGEAMARKQQEIGYARTELRRIEPHLARTSAPVAADAEARRIGETIATAANEAEEVQKREARVRRSVATAVRNAPVSIEDRAAVVGTPSTASETAQEFQPEEISSLFGEE